MRVKILKNLAYLMVFFITLLPLPWSSYRLKTVSWPDLFVFAVILVEIYFYIRSYKKKTFKIKDLLLVVPLISIIMAFYSFVMIFTGSPDISFHSKIYSYRDNNIIFYKGIVYGRQEYIKRPGLFLCLRRFYNCTSGFLPILYRYSNGFYRQSGYT